MASVLRLTLDGNAVRQSCIKARLGALGKYPVSEPDKPNLSGMVTALPEDEGYDVLLSLEKGMRTAYPDEHITYMEAVIESVAADGYNADDVAEYTLGSDAQNPQSEAVS